MGQISPYLRSVFKGQIGHWCPACKEMHHFAITQKNSCGAIWSWNGDSKKPSFIPSMHISANDPEDGYRECCHYWLKDGKISYLGDCTHAMAGLTVDLPPLPPDLQDRPHGNKTS